MQQPRCNVSGDGVDEKTIITSPFVVVVVVVQRSREELWLPICFCRGLARVPFYPTLPFALHEK
jgi:hypothetical protein